MRTLPAKGHKMAKGPDNAEDPRRRSIAKFLLRRLNEANCEQYGVSKVDISRLREVAYGAREKDRRS
jgi:hypothetical protein